MKIFSYLILLVIVIIGISFAYINASPVTLNYYFNSSTLPLSMLLVCTFAIGGLLGLLAGLILYIKQKICCRKLQNRVSLAEQEITNLRKMPISDAR